MENELNGWWNKIKNTDGLEQKELFLLYCARLIQLKEEKKLTEEEVAYNIIGAMQFDNLANSPEYNVIFDIAEMMEIPRTFLHCQSSGEWDEENSNQIKEKEWKNFVDAVKNTKLS